MNLNNTNEEEEETKNNNFKQNKVSFLKLFSYSDRYDYILMFFGSIGAIIHGVSIPIFFIYFGKMINLIGEAYLFPKETSHEVSKYSIYFVYLSVVVMFSSWFEVACWIKTGERQVGKIRMAYLRSTLNQDISLFDTQSCTGEVINAITCDILLLQDAISEKVGKILHYISRFIGGFIVGFITVWQISLVTLSIVPVIALAGGIYAYIATGLIVRVQKSYVEAGEIADEVIANVRMVQAFTGEEIAVNSYKTALMKTYKYGMKGGIAKGLGLGSLQSVLFLSWALLVWYTSLVVHKGVANGGECFTTMFNVVIAGISLGQAAPDITSIIRARVAAYPIFSMITRAEGRKSNSTAGKKLQRVDGHIEFKDIYFSYPSRPDAKIFEKFCLDIPAGKIIALVGGSGSGKSTLISLIERFYEPFAGNILLDGIDIKELELKWLRHQIGVVNQEPALFGTSIRENILYGKEDATTDEIDHAAELAEAISFINKLPERYDTQVGERGIQLSGGQKQRIAIARAILKNPSILLLDEATSALDAESEKSVQDSLERVMVGRTTIVVAHRLSTIRNADTIVVLRDGKVVESGSHDELIANQTSAYSSLVKLQENSSYSNLTSPVPLSTAHALETSPASNFVDSDNKDYITEDERKTEQVKKTKKLTWRRLISMVGHDWKYGVLGSICCVFAGAEMPLFALGVTQALVSYYMEWEVTRSEVKKIAFLFCAGAVITVFNHGAAHTCFGIMGERLTLRVRHNMFSAILRNEIGWFDDPKNSSSNLSSRLAIDSTLLRSIIVDRATILLLNCGFIVTAFIIAFILNWRLTLVVLAMYPFIISGHLSEKLFMQGYGGDLGKEYLSANILAREAVGNIRTVVAFSAEEKVLDLYARELVEPSRRSFTRGQITGTFYGVTQFFVFSSYGLALWYGSTLMEKGISGFESVMKSFIVLVVTALGMGETLAMAPDLLKGNQLVESVFEVLDRRTRIKSDSGEEMSKVEGYIEFRDVQFGYPSRPGILVFKDLNLKVPAGQSMALVGRSGSGKSSVISLILRFYDPISGNVLVDGKDLKRMNLKSLRRHIGIVQQEPALFATTIYENIVYGKDGSTESEVIEASKLSNAHSFISSLPEGYNTKVGERGIQLSGGQKQRVAIARAILKNPAILLLDEATSALDMESERVVREALDVVMKNRTTVLVAHRLSTIKNADQISVIEDGRVIEQGTHSNLVRDENGPYYNLIKLQQQSEPDL